MKVITLHTDDFQQKCRELAQIIGASGTDYNFIVGIAKGGDYVGKIVASELALAGTKYMTVLSQRPSTRRKTKFIGTILRSLPTWLNNRLRIIEAKLLASRKHKDKIDVEINSDDCKSIATSMAPKILIIDDAVDSGNTMRSVIDELKSINPYAIINTAAITQTTTNPVVNIDFLLYKNNTLIRFPWSKDMKRKQ